LQLRPLVLSDLVESMLPRLRQLFGRDIEIVPDLRRDMPPVIADPVQVRHIILKLATNSLEASQPGKGATFRIYFPLAGTHFPALPAPPVGRLPGSATILLVEANDGMRSVMANLLKKRGYRVLAALHSKEALRITAAQGPPDLLICRPAPELAGNLARTNPQLRVLYLGGYADGLAAQDQGLPSRTSLLQKPFEPETLLATVRGLLSQPL
jgi:CheY-like chemotaxis protein